MTAGSVGAVGAGKAPGLETEDTPLSFLLRLLPSFLLFIVPLDMICLGLGVKEGYEVYEVDNSLRYPFLFIVALLFLLSLVSFVSFVPFPRQKFTYKTRRMGVDFVGEANVECRDE